MVVAAPMPRARVITAAAAKPGFLATIRRPYRDRKSTRLNSSHSQISYAVFCLKKKNKHRVRKRPIIEVMRTPSTRHLGLENMLIGENQSPHWLQQRNHPQFFSLSLPPPLHSLL